MATIAPTRPKIHLRPPAGTPPLHRITVDEYERIIELGALEDPSRVELIDGYMVDKMGKNAEHTLHDQGNPQGVGQPAAGRVDVAEGRAGADPHVR